MTSGVLNQHPRTAMAHMESDHKEKITEFYDTMVNSTDSL
jgi:hypothetical protein